MIRAALLVLTVCAAAHADVFVLDASGAGDFATLQEVDAGTVDGDIVLVRPGNYPASASTDVEFGGKGLTIMADGTGPVSFPSVRIYGVLAGQTFVLRGVRLENDLPPLGGIVRLQVDGVFGSVVVEDCIIAGISPSIVTTNFTVNVVAANLALESCEIVGGAGMDKFSALSHAYGGNWGLRALGSHVSVSNCKIVGGVGGDEPLGWEEEGAGAGGPAIVCAQSTLLLSGCSVVGGAGGHDTGDPQPGGAPAGGAGIIADAESLVRLRDTTVVGGVGGTDASDIDGPLGTTVVVPPGVMPVMLPGPARILQMEAPLEELGASQLEVEGEPGELALLLGSTAGAWVDVPKFGGALLVGAPVGQLLPLGALDASGHLQASIVVPDLGLSPGSAVRALLQLVTTTGSSTVLGDASALVLLGT
jgi:hypothetical protein